MSGRIRPFLAQVGLVGVAAVAVFFVTRYIPAQDTTYVAPAAVQSAFLYSTTTSNVVVASTSPDIGTTTRKTAGRPTVSEDRTPTTVDGTTTPTREQTTAPVPQQNDDEVHRVQNAYASAPLSAETVNQTTRAALVNILCTPRAGATIRPTSASGIIIDPRGIILTNAHVAQYVLLSETPVIDQKCVIRSGSPATVLWSADVLYIPPAWIRTHASDINKVEVRGTGEDDFALLRITGTLDGSPLGELPHLPIDAREGIAFPGDQILVAGYPAEFVGNLAATNNFYPVSSVSTVKSLMTFATSSIDILSLGGVIEAQSGSSGGPIVNAWGKLVGIIVTTSDGASTADRDLHALSLSYIDRTIKEYTGSNLETILSGDTDARAKNFGAKVAPALIKLYIDVLSGK